MKMKRTILWTGAMLVTMILSIGIQVGTAASPAGEVKTAATMFGNQVPIPYLEIAHANDWMQLLFDPLVGCTPDGKFSSDLGIANKWEMSPDALTWTFTLRRGVKFHDGVELTAKDVKLSIEQQLLPDSSGGDAVILNKLIKSIEIKDPYLIVIHCKQPAVFLINFFSNMEGTTGMVIPKDYYEKVGKDEFSKRPVGSGPYKFHSQMAGSFVKLEATEKHWRDGVPRFKYMTYLIIPEESTRIAMLRTGEADVTRISRAALKEAVSSGLNIVTKENGGVVVFTPNMQWTSPAFADIRFRKALNLAIDREAIIKHLFGGVAKPLAAYPGSNIFAVGGDRTLKPYPYDFQEARRLIKEGGWEGHEFTLLSYPRAGCPEFQQIVETVAGYWEKIGLKPRIRMTEWAVWRKAWRERKTQNTIHGYDDSTNPDAGALLTKFQEKWYFKNVLSSVNMPELNEKFERIEKSLDIKEISKLMADIYRVAYDNYLMVTICEIPDKIATTKKIPKWDPGLRRTDRNYYDLIRQR